MQNPARKGKRKTWKEEEKDPDDVPSSDEMLGLLSVNKPDFSFPFDSLTRHSSLQISKGREGGGDKIDHHIIVGLQ